MSNDLQLPAVRPFRQFCRHADGWSDHYGALHTAAEYAGFTMPASYAVKAIWQHGCFGPWETQSPGLLVFNSPAAGRFPIFVARQDQADLLKASGYTQARAIGLPIHYTPEPSVVRIPRSLLVMPTHSLAGAKFEDLKPFDEYAEEVKRLEHRFDRIVVCVHANCLKNGHWINEFKSRGFEVIYGAQTNDRNALSRMRALFSQFEYVTSNGWGSHIAYALAFGAKVSIFGKEIEQTKANVMMDVALAANPEAVDPSRIGSAKEDRNKCLQRLFCRPHEGVLDVAWGRWLTGFENLLTPAEMGDLLPVVFDPPLKRSGQSPAKRVLFVSHEASRTGAPMFLLHLVRWLRENTELSFEILLAQGGPLEDAFSRVAVVRQPKEFSEDPDLIRSYALVYSNTACNGLLLERLGCADVPVITHVHELDIGFNWLGARAMAALVRQSSRFIACAEAVSVRLQTVFSIPPARISVHYEMIDSAAVLANRSKDDVAALRKAYDLPENALVITACGTFDLRKGPDLFVQVAARIKRTMGNHRPLRFLWIGSQNTIDLLAAAREDVRKLGMQREVTFVGELPSPHALIGLSDVFCLTSREDPFPLIMLEAALLEKPVICFSGAGGAVEFCAAGGGLAVPYLDTAAMADLACELLCNPARRQEVGARSAVVVQERFTVDAVAPALWRELKEYLAVPLALPPERSSEVSLANIFRQWALDQAPQPSYLSAYLTRDDALRKSRLLLGQGRRKEAAQILVGAVSADVATKQPGIICEGLLEIAREMEKIDTRQAAAMQEQARQLAARAGLKLDTVVSSKSNGVPSAA